MLTLFFCIHDSISYFHLKSDQTMPAMRESIKRRNRWKCKFSESRDMQMRLLYNRKLCHFFFFVAVAWYVISDSLRKKRGECCMWLFCESLSLETLSILAAKKSSLWIELDFIFVDCKLCQSKSVGIHLV